MSSSEPKGGVFLGPVECSWGESIEAPVHNLPKARGDTYVVVRTLDVIIRSRRATN